MSESRFFVAGATGYTGGAVVARALELGACVMAHVRPGSRSGDARAVEFARLGAQVDRSPWQGDALTLSVAEFSPTHVFGLLGTTARRGKDDGSTYETVDRDLTLHLLEAAQAASSRPCFVYLSSLGADANASNAYLAVRGVVETAVRSSALPYVIARPSFITGADRGESRPGERIAATLVDGGLRLVRALGGRMLAERYASVDAGLLARALCAAGIAERQGHVVVDTVALRKLAAA